MTDLSPFWKEFLDEWREDVPGILDGPVVVIDTATAPDNTTALDGPPTMERVRYVTIHEAPGLWTWRFW